MLLDQLQEGLVLESTERVMVVKGASPIHAELLETMPLFLSFGQFSISTQDVTKVLPGGTGVSP